MNENSVSLQGLLGIDRARAVVRVMLSADGCAWHAAQTHETLTKYLIEEAYETADAIDTGSATHTAEELGDVLYQVLFHSEIAVRDNEGYSLDTIAETLADKLVARHPHVFADRGYMSEAELNAEWEHLKEAAQGDPRGSRHPLEGIPRSMASLPRAAKVIERLRRAGVVDLGAGSAGGAAGAGGSVSAGTRLDETQLGDELLGLVREAARQGIDADRALRQATNRFAADALGESAPS